MKYFKYSFLFVILLISSCQKDIDLSDQALSSQTDTNYTHDNSEEGIQDSISPSPCLNITQTGYDEDGCCIYIVKLPRGIKYNGQSFSLNASNGATVTNIVGQVVSWEVIVCDQTDITLISEANETSYIECNMTLDCTPEENCCDAFCIEVELSQEVDDEGCFQITMTFFQYCIGEFYFVLDDNYEVLFDNIEVQSSQKLITIDMCSTFEGYNIENFILEGIFATDNCGTYNIGPVAIFDGETDPVICNSSS